jgi:hypothetical protein
VAHAAATLPFSARPMGQTYQTWFQRVGQFFLGDAANPLIAGLEGDCGQVIGGVFFMTAPIDVGVELDCEVPVGTAIVLSHAGYFATLGVEGDTDEELQAAVEAGFVVTSNTLTLDGAAVPLRTLDTGAFDVISEEGSFYDAILGEGTGPIRTALRGNLVFFHPLPPGEHTIEAAVTFADDGGDFSATYHLVVGGTKR